jgi:phosphoribosylanthranilate isomerase
MIIKVCGTTNAADAQAAIDAGATAIGFNFYPHSPRYITPERAAAIATPGVRRVGVFVNEAPARIAEIARIAALDTAQLHGDESPADYPEHLTVWKAARVTPAFKLSAFTRLPVEALLLDGPAATPASETPIPGSRGAAALYGGSGRTFDWSLAAVSGHRIILAGGLDGHNVARAIAIAHPWGVDSCSRIESVPGIKDHQKMNRYIQAARAALAA